MINMLELFDINKSILKKIDKDIINHGEETAYIVYRIAKDLGYEGDELYNLIVLAYMHDIGAYKTEEMNNIKQFDVVDTGRHSIYGYTLICQNAKLGHLAPIILYHHHSYKDRDKYIKDIPIQEEAFLIGLADRVSIWCNLLKYNEEKILKHISKINKDLYHTEYLNRLLYLIENEGIIKDIISGDYREKLQEVFKSRRITVEDTKKYLVFLPITVDFFSGETSLHTVSVSSITKKICEKMDLDEEYKNKIELGAYLHDVGKVCTPRNILEKEGKLTPEEFEIMKNHVIDTREILKDTDINKELLDLACNHHEKLDGSGYPQGLDYNRLTTGDRIVAVSDIFCALSEKRHYKKPFSKEKVIEILSNMVKSKYIDKDIVQIVIENYDEFLEYLIENRYRYEVILNNMVKKYKIITKKVDAILG